MWHSHMFRNVGSWNFWEACVFESVLCNCNCERYEHCEGHPIVAGSVELWIYWHENLSVCRIKCLLEKRTWYEWNSHEDIFIPFPDCTWKMTLEYTWFSLGFTFTQIPFKHHSHCNSPCQKQDYNQIWERKEQSKDSH